MKSLAVAVLLSFGLSISACGGGSGKNNPNPPKAKPGYVNWNSIPDEFNPNTETVGFDISNIEKIDVNLFGFNRDFQVRYSSSLASDRASIELFTVKSSDSRTHLSGVNVSKSYSDLKLSQHGNFQCSIKIQNSQITKLSGACYVKVILTLPPNVEVEAYNVGKLVSKRYFPIDNVTFLDDLDDASFAKDKFKVIDTYLESYKITSKTPELSSKELGTAIGEFSYKDDKFDVLRKLHKFVADRESLKKMIEDSFSYFDREEARKIVGLN